MLFASYSTLYVHKTGQNMFIIFIKICTSYVPKIQTKFILRILAKKASFTVKVAVNWSVDL